MCGIVGISANFRVTQQLYDALTLIQHRGQDAAGIMTSDRERIYLRKANGLVRDAIQLKHMQKLKGNMGIGHVRYPTAGTESSDESQPFYQNAPYGLGLVHNGNLTNTAALTKTVVAKDLRYLNTASDSEVLLNVFAHELQSVAHSPLSPDTIFKAVRNVYQRLSGAFSVIVMIHGYGLLAFRDPYGIRPLVYGKAKEGSDESYCFVSESIALNVLGYELMGDVKPGEAIFIDLEGKLHRASCAAQKAHAPCLFEYIYLARSDSLIDGISVYRARYNMGVKLAEKILNDWGDHDIDVIIPVPDTSRTAGIALAKKLDVNYSEGFVKNRYIGRTFIMPEQSQRRNSVRLKLNAISEEFKGKNVLLVDDSIVRGTTSKEIIQMARDAGAKKVYFASAAPKIAYPNVYGIDMPTAEALIGHNRTTFEIADILQADKLIYQTIGAAREAVSDAAILENKINSFEDSVFTGNYITGDINKNYLENLSRKRHK